MDINWWRVYNMGVPGEGACEARQGCAAERMWRNACHALDAGDVDAAWRHGEPARADAAWRQIVDASPPDAVWHSLRNCVAYQAGVWQKLLIKGIDDVLRPAAFKLAVVLRHTPSDLTINLLTDLLHTHPQAQDLISYILALLTDDEATCTKCGSIGGVPPIAGAELETNTPAPLRDRQLFGDCELAVLAASRVEYDAHAKLVRAEYSQLTHDSYVELRIKVLNQFSQIPKLFHTAEFECFEGAARENIEREICTLREHLLTGRSE